MPKFKIHHTTRYIYEDSVRDSANQIMLYPVKDDFQEIINHTIIVTGSPQIAIHVDYFGNEVGTFTYAHPHNELTIDSKLEIVTRERPIPEDTLAPSEQWVTLERLKHQFNFIDFLRLEPFKALPEMQEVINKEQCAGCTPFQVAKDFTAYIYNNFKYQKGITTVESTPDEIWNLRSGVCQDFAHMLLYMLRLVSIPARYVSGYICSNNNDMRGEGATHAWVEAYIPTFGWIGLDPTNNCVVNSSHVRLAVGKNFSDCSPVKGTYRGTSNHTLEVTVSVQYEDGNQVKNTNEINETVSEPIKSFSRNSFRRFQEMQMQQ
jgi:transglutaminase-like putative cysteine protease